jgi:hypothetical protein
MSRFLLVLPLVLSLSAQADENLFGYLAGSDTLPKGSREAYLWLTQRSDKGAGHLQAQSIDTAGLVIDGYLPGDQSYSMKLSGFEVKGKYNFLSAAIAPVGLSASVALEHSWLDPHSGRDKNTTSLLTTVALNRYMLDDQLIGVANVGMESTYADRAEIASLPEGFDWPTDPEMEIELQAGAGLTYRVAPRWFVGAETMYQTEFETEVRQERWSWNAGPTLHYADRAWWATLTWMPQIEGGGEQYAGQLDSDLHLIEKTKQEVRLKIGFNF